MFGPVGISILDFVGPFWFVSTDSEAGFRFGTLRSTFSACETSKNHEICKFHEISKIGKMLFIKIEKMDFLADKQAPKPI